MRYQPALDGLRGVAVAVVLAFHLGVPGTSGGYLGVSVFFTLSGFLITTLLLQEQRSRGRIQLTYFYARRMRRLLPAALVCLAAIAALGANQAFGDRAGLRADVLAAVFDVANWRALLGDQSYAELFLSPSPSPTSGRSPSRSSSTCSDRLLWPACLHCGSGAVARMRRSFPCSSPSP